MECQQVSQFQYDEQLDKLEFGEDMDYIELESERLLFKKYKMEDYSVFYDMLSNLAL